MTQLGSLDVKILHFGLQYKNTREKKITGVCEDDSGLFQTFCPVCNDKQDIVIRLLDNEASPGGRQ